MKSQKRLKDMKSDLKHMKSEQEVLKVNKCFEELTNFHDCRESQFKLRYETMRRLKEVKNNIIETLQRELTEVKLENTTLNFIVETIENPEALSVKRKPEDDYGNV